MFLIVDILVSNYFCNKFPHTSWPKQRTMYSLQCEDQESKIKVLLGLWGGPLWLLWTHQVNQDNLSISRHLTSSHLQNAFCWVTHSPVWVIRKCTSLGGEPWVCLPHRLFEDVNCSIIRKCRKPENPRSTTMGTDPWKDRSCSSPVASCSIMKKN